MGSGMGMDPKYTNEISMVGVLGTGCVCVGLGCERAGRAGI